MNVREFSAATGLSPHTVRFYDRLGLFQVARAANGHRVFAEKDVEWAAFIKRLKDTDMPLEQIRRYAALRSQGRTTIPPRMRLLEAHAAELERDIALKQEHLRRLRQKLASYAETSSQNA